MLTDSVKPAPTAPDERPEIVLRPSTGRLSLNLGELWTYRELLYFLVWRDIKVRYKQTVLGAAWAVLQPFLTMVVFSLFFGRLAGVPSDGIPYPIFAFSGLVPWTYFANAISQASNSLVEHERMITKVYFPRLLIPMAPVVAGWLDLAIALVVLVAMMAAYGLVPTAAVLAVPLYLLLAAVTALGVGLWLSALNAQYRDVRYVVPFLVQFWLLATPIAYPASLVPAQWRPLYGLNPMAGVVAGFRYVLLGGERPGMLLAVSVGVALLLLLSGLVYFRRTERGLADVV
jgi:lipopolysaccharide transport system permease protein